MTPPVADLFARLHALGIRLLRLDRGRISFRAPRGVMNDELRSLIDCHRAELLLALGDCPGCRKPLDRGRCWKCHWRRCRCGRDTGSAFISTCILCEQIGDESC